MRLDDGDQSGPRDDFRHAGEELFAAGGLLLGRKLGVGKRGLVGQALQTRAPASSFKKNSMRIESAFP